MNDEQFFERLRGDAARLRGQPDEMTLMRIRARIHSRLARPGVAELLAAWFRPLAATLAAVSIAAAVALSMAGTNDETETGSTTVEITMAGDAYSVGN